MTHLRQAMLEELHRRNYAPSTITYYVKNVEQFARYFKRSPDRLTPTHLRTYQAYLLRDRKLAPRTVKLHVCAIPSCAETRSMVFLRHDSVNRYAAAR